MPFTFSHPAIVLTLSPWYRIYFSSSALIAGSMSPDFEYFFRMKVESSFSHSPDALFWFNLPLSLLLLYIFHNLLRNPLIDHLPACLHARFSVYKDFRWNVYAEKRLPMIAFSVLIGAASHILWDAFTHEHGFFVEEWALLREATPVQGWPLFKWLQHGSTLLGALFILYTLKRLPRFESRPSVSLYAFWVKVLAITLLCLALRLWAAAPSAFLPGNVLVSTISGALLGTGLVSAFSRR